LRPGVIILARGDRKSWWPLWSLWSLGDIGLFIANNIIALCNMRAVLGLLVIVMPIIVAGAFLTVIYWQRHYVKRGRGYE
jgi:hypothetical protein